MKIIVPVDGSEFSEQAIPCAQDIASRCDATLHLVRVHQYAIDLSIAPVSAALCEAVDHETRDAEIRYLRRLQSSCTAHDVNIFSLDAPVAEALAEHVAEHAADLVIMTTHGRGGLSRAWLGSVADRLVRMTRVPVLMLRPGRDCAVHGHGFSATRILIPLDGSLLAESIIEPAITFGALTGAGYTLLQVVAPAIAGSPQTARQSELDAVTMRRESLAYLELTAVRMRSRGLDVESRVILQSNTAAAIAEAAVHAKCDVIAMATHGRSGWSRVALGSIADKVLRTTPMPLLVLRPDMIVAEKIA